MVENLLVVAMKVKKSACVCNENLLISTEVVVQ